MGRSRYDVGSRQVRLEGCYPPVLYLSQIFKGVDAIIDIFKVFLGDLRESRAGM